MYCKCQMRSIQSTVLGLTKSVCEILCRSAIPQCPKVQRSRAVPPAVRVTAAFPFMKLLAGFLLSLILATLPWALSLSFFTSSRIGYLSKTPVLSQSSPAHQQIKPPPELLSWSPTPLPRPHGCSSSVRWTNTTCTPRGVLDKALCAWESRSLLSWTLCSNWEDGPQASKCK